MKNAEKICYDMKELYSILPVGWNKLYEVVNSKGFPKITVGRRILIPKSAFEEWLITSAAEQKNIC